MSDILKGLVFAIVLALSVLLFTACGQVDNAERIQEVAEARDQCEGQGGRFEQWRDGWGSERFRCDFSTRPSGWDDEN